MPLTELKDCVVLIHPENETALSAPIGAGVTLIKSLVPLNSAEPWAGKVNLGGVKNLFAITNPSFT
jgi:hypothetical protein